MLKIAAKMPLIGGVIPSITLKTLKKGHYFEITGNPTLISPKISCK